MMMVQDQTMGFRRGNYLRPVNTLKHVVDIQGGLVIGANTANTLVFGVDNPTATALPTEVTTGSHVKSIFLNVQVAATSGAALANVYMYVIGNPGGVLTTAQLPVANAVGTSNQRKQIFHQEMLMVEKINPGISRTLFKGVIKLPRKFNRIGANDVIHIVLLAPGVTMDFCVQCIYKEIR